MCNRANCLCMCGSSWGGTGDPDPPPPPENYKNIGFLSNTSPDPFKITKLPSQQPMFGHYRPASETPFNWRFAGGPMMAQLYRYLDPLSPHQIKKIKKNVIKVGPPLTKLPGSAHALHTSYDLHGFLPSIKASPCLCMIRYLLSQSTFFFSINLGWFTAWVESILSNDTKKLLDSKARHLVTSQAFYQPSTVIL